MTFVTILTLSSGDRTVLENVVSDIKTAASRKGVQLKGPQTPPPESFRVPQPKRLHPDGGEFESWSYSVYTRTIRIVGYDDFARTATQRSFPHGIHVEAEVEQVKGAGRT